MRNWGSHFRIAVSGRVAAILVLAGGWLTGCANLRQERVVSTGGESETGYGLWVSCEMRLENLCLLYGQVHQPGYYEVPWDGSVRKLVEQAGGWTEYANPTTVKIVRDGSVITNEYSSRELDFRLPVHAGDLVFIEENLFTPAPPRDIEIAVPERWKRARAIYKEMSTGGMGSSD